MYDDRGYDSAPLRSAMQGRGLESRIAARSRRSNETRVAKAERIDANQPIFKTRVRVEHSFATMKHNMACGLYHGLGLARAQSEIGLTCLVYNMVRLSFLQAKIMLFYPFYALFTVESENILTINLNSPKSLIY